MTDAPSVRFGKIALAVALVVSLSTVLVGCGKAADKTATPAGSSAKGALAAAQSTLSTTAPDAKLLVVQTGSVVASGAAPVWQYLFGSPKTDEVYVVTVVAGKASAQPYGTAGLSAAEWKAVPGIDTWKVDSDEALKKAFSAYTNAKTTTAYLMGFVTYVPKTKDNGTKPMIWDVTFDPASLGQETTSTVHVNITTGETALAK